MLKRKCPKNKFDPIEMCTEFVQGVTRLKLWYARWLLTQDRLDFETVFTKRLGIIETTPFAADPATGKAQDTDGWLGVVGKLRRLYDLHEVDVTSAEIEVQGLALLMPYLEPCIEGAVARDAQWLEGAVGCFSYEYRSFYPESEGADHLTLHVRNAYQPDTLFHHVNELVGDLQEIVKRTESRRPDVASVQCATWLNSVPAFAGLFPPSWIDTSIPGQPGGHTGWWGQFMDRRGGFNENNARKFRETGCFPFGHCMCRCGVSQLKEHLARFVASEPE